MELFDAHCHIQDPRLEGHVDEVIAAAHAAGVRRFSVNGTNEGDWDKVRRLAERRADVTPNFGLHPWFVAGRSEAWLERLREALEAVPSAGLGEVLLKCGLKDARQAAGTATQEHLLIASSASMDAIMCGLDKARQAADMATQERLFRQQLRLGKELSRPISVHCVRAFGKLLEVVQQEGPFPAGLVLHAWGGPAEMVAPLAEVEGVHFSIAGHITRMPSDKAAAMVKEIPLDRLLLETDAPDGLPQISNAGLARKLEAAAGSSLRVVALPAEMANGHHSGCCTADNSRSCDHSSGSHRTGSDTADGGGRHASEVAAGGRDSSGSGQLAPDSGSNAAAEMGGGAARSNTAATAEGSRAAVEAGSSRSLECNAAGGVAAVPLGWRCPLDVNAAGGAVRIEDPRQLLNQPANIRLILHLVAELRGEDAAELAAASVRNAERLFCRRWHASS